jgi:hypothetical protein
VNDYTNDTTHLIASRACTEKHRQALLIETPVLFPTWIEDCYSEETLLPTEEYKLLPLSGCLLSSTGFSPCKSFSTHQFRFEVTNK